MKKHLSIMMIIALLLGLAATAYAAETCPNVVTREYGDVKLHSFLSVSVSPVIVEHDSLVLIDYPGDSQEQAAAFKAYVDGLGKPVDRIIISHVDAAHWVGIEAFFPDVPLYSVDADGVMALPEAAVLTIQPIVDDAALEIDGVSYAFETDRGIGAWAIKLPAQRAAYVEHMGYVNLHVLLAPLEPRLAPLEPRLALLEALAGEGYTWFMPGHGIPMEAPAFIDLVSAYYGDVLDAVARNENPQDAVAEIAEKYPAYNTPDMLAGLLPALYE